ncbi:MAG: DNA mismatch repair protein MutS [Elusimicrobiota bacterium]
METVEIPDTPLMKQYAFLKKKHKDSILFFRLGDFYEMFGEDAKKASAALSLTLTSRQGVPMCGVPHHSSVTYISRLIKMGYRVAVCEQIGEEDGKSKLFKREVVRIITPGTLIEDDLLDKKSSNYLFSIFTDIVGWGVSYCDISTGEFKATQNLNDPDFHCLRELIARVMPSEIVIDHKSAEIFSKWGFKFSLPAANHFFEYEPSPLEQEREWKNRKLALKAAALAYSYIVKTQPSTRFSFSPSYFEDKGLMRLDETAIKTLELVDADYEGGISLWKTLDYSKTSMGSRMLKRWILNPLADIYSVKVRQDLTAFLVSAEKERNDLAALLEASPDIERISGRISSFSLTPRDAFSLGKSLSLLPRFKSLLSSEEFVSVAGFIANRLADLTSLTALKEEIEKAVSPEPPARISDGGAIAEGYDKELDELRSIRKNSQMIISQMEAKERQSTGINSLKISYTSNFGYFIEVTKTHLQKVPQNYIRRQTLTNAERFSTSELKALEDKILGAEDKILKLENAIFEKLKEKILSSLAEIRIYSLCLAELDAFYSLAEAAVKNDYVKPEITNENFIEIIAGRHPVVEKYLPSGEFVPNDFSIGENRAKMVILTGPNMSGKSVYLRQNALCVLMAQIGSFVPAEKAVIGIADRIMTRIGAHDRLSRGESTFMVEMKETAEILKSATPRSLVLLDEIGRGTSTFDGISIAKAVCEYLYKKNAMTVFATHYFEMTELPLYLEGVRNFNISAKEWTNSEGKKELVFLHKIVPGPADKSYGIHVAELAGLPKECVLRAGQILSELEKAPGPKKDISQDFLPLFDTDSLSSKIAAAEIEKMTPLEALNFLSELKKEISK